MSQTPVVLSTRDQDLVFDAIVKAAEEFGYRLTDAVIEATHVHWIVAHDDEVATMVGRLKTRMRQHLDRGRIWTADFSHRLLYDERALEQARNYLTKHQGLRMLAGRVM
jgi:REP element-mobilizing transposase RayT